MYNDKFKYSVVIVIRLRRNADVKVFELLFKIKF